ncbi:uncharacterized protein LOC135194597 [Vanessa tameamea]|uniref:Uncharacterized protein LOC135194597 n=1 Tax=Vanessa tameamea TaxID=334116 RepID=A0ABM4AYB7_VANTA
MTDDKDALELITQLRLDLNERDQELLLNDVEITGLEEKSGENSTHLIMSLAKKLGADLDERDIVSVARSGPRRIAADSGERPPRPRPLVVRLARRSVRDTLLRAARVRRGTDSSGITDTEPRRVYVNERLTGTNRQLFYKTREECRRHGWRFSWTKNGRIYVRKNDSSEIRRIRSSSDIEKFFGVCMV